MCRRAGAKRGHGGVQRHAQVLAVGQRASALVRVCPEVLHQGGWQRHARPSREWRGCAGMACAAHNALRNKPAGTLGAKTSPEEAATCVFEGRQRQRVREDGGATEVPLRCRRVRVSVGLAVSSASRLHSRLRSMSHVDTLHMGGRSGACRTFDGVAASSVGTCAHRTPWQLRVIYATPYTHTEHKCVRCVLCAVPWPAFKLPRGCLQVVCPVREHSRPRLGSASRPGSPATASPACQGRGRARHGKHAAPCLSAP